MNGLFQDFSFFLRQTRRRPVWTLSVIGVLALGIAANTAMYAGFDAWVVRPLPFNEPDSLFDLQESDIKRGVNRDVSPAVFADLETRDDIFAGLAAFDGAFFNVSDTSEPVRVIGARVTATLFPLLGVEPELGRLFLPEDDRPGQPGSVALISHRQWVERYGADPYILGTTIRLNGRVHEIVGVLPDTFAFPSWSDVWAPMGLDPGPESRGQRSLEVVARLRPEVSRATAQQVLDSLGTELESQYPETQEGFGLAIRPLREYWVPDVIEIALGTSTAAALFLLLIVCANVAGLMLAQATSRGKELALRAALGASRWRLVRQSILESIALSSVAGLFGLLLAEWWIEGMYSQAPIEPPYLFSMRLSPRIALYTLCVSLLAGLVSALAPVLRSSGIRAHDALRASGRAMFSKSGAKLRTGLVIAELTLSTALAIGALLMVKSFILQQSVDPGYRTDDVATMEMSLTDPEFSEPEARRRFLERVHERVRESADIHAVGSVNTLPSGGAYERIVAAEGQALEAGEGERVALITFAGDYLETLEIPILEGRGFTRAEMRDVGDVVLVSESLARRLSQDGSLIGRRLRTVEPEQGPWLDIVGVVRDVRGSQDMVPQDLPSHQIYRPYLALPTTTVTLSAASEAPPETVADVVRDAVRSAGGAVPVSEVLSMKDAIFRVQWVTEFFGREMVIYGLIALFIASVGLYGLVADSVSGRTRELAIRMAVGARREELMRAIVVGALKLAATGTAAGLALGVGGAKLGASMIVGVRPADPVVLGGVGILLSVTCALASYLPARQAASLDPALALRSE